MRLSNEPAEGTPATSAEKAHCNTLEPSNKEVTRGTPAQIREGTPRIEPSQNTNVPARSGPSECGDAASQDKKTTAGQPTQEHP